MTEWHHMSFARQSWTVYRIVRGMPNAQVEDIRDAILRRYGVRKKLRWCKIRLRNFSDRNILRSGVIDGKQVWYAVDDDHPVDPR